MFVLQRCLYKGGVRIREVSVLQRCLYYHRTHVCIRCVSILEKCPYLIEGCSYNRGVRIRGTDERGVPIREVSVLERMYERKSSTVLLSEF